MPAPSRSRHAVHHRRRLLGRVRGPDDGPTVVCVGGLHGNEPAGVIALKSVFSALGKRADEVRGEAVALAGNLSALAQGERSLGPDLNRIWDRERLTRLRQGGAPVDREEEELRELDAQIRRLAETARGPLFAVDLHTTSAPGPAFLIADHGPAAHRLIRLLPVPEVRGLGAVLPGTFLNHLASEGVVAVAVECGRHDDPASPARAEAAVWTMLAAMGVLPTTTTEAVRGRARLRREHAGFPPRVDVFYRHPVAPGDGFVMDPGFASFQRVAKGQALARSRVGVVRAPRGGLLLMPLYQARGSDGFFLARLP